MPQSRAKGAVEFRNITQKAVTIPEGTMVNTGSIRFETTEEVVVSAGIGKNITASIQAVEGGVAGNVDAKTINAVEGRIGLSVTVTNPDPITGGRELASVQASDGDRDRVKAALLKSLQASARDKFLSELNSGDVLFDSTIQMTQILSEKYDPPPGAVGAKVTASIQAEFTAQYASASDLTELATLAMNASLPSGFRAASEAVTAKPLSDPFLDADGTSKWNMRAEREIIQSFDSMSVTQLVQGLGVKKAQSNLEKNLPSESKPTLQLSPPFWRWVPLLPFRIEVITN